MIVRIFSFGFKYGSPPESDLLFDVRFFPNPYYLPDLQETTGLEPVTASYVLDNETGRNFFKYLLPLLQFLLKQYKDSERDAITIGIGCTGGRHRSVAISEKLAIILADKKTKVIVNHPDLSKKVQKGEP